MISGLRTPRHWNLSAIARHYGLPPKRVASQAIIGAVLLASCAVGLHASLFYLALPVGVGVALLFLRRPLIGLLLTLLGGMSIPWTGPGGVNLTIVGLLFLITLWLLSMFMAQGDLQLAVAQVTRPALLLLALVAFALVVGQVAWYRTQAAPLSAQLGGFTVFVTAIGALLFVGHQVKAPHGLAILTGSVILYGSLHMIGWIEPHLGRYLRLLYQDGATTSMFWTWVVTLSLSQALFNRRLGWGWRLVLLGVVAMTFYVAYGLNGDWKSGWMPALLSAALLVLFRCWRLRYFLALSGLLPALNLVVKAIASDEYSYTTRLEAWAIVGEIVKVNPLLGLGPANYYWYTPLFRIRGYTVNFNSHNQYVDLVAQSGVLGLLAYLWLLGALGWLGWRLRHRVADGFEKAYVYGALAGWVATVATGALGDWVLPFVYNVGLSGVRSSILPWIFLGGLLALERKYSVKQVQCQASTVSSKYSVKQVQCQASMTLLSIIIVNWNTCTLLAACLASVEAELASFAADQVETWVIDNASTDGSVGVVQRRFPWVRLLKNSVNLGFAGANNQAMQVARGRYFFLLNADTELRRGALPTLVQFMEAHPQAAAAGARYLNPDGSLQMSCYPAPTLVREVWRLFHLDRLYPFGVYPMATWCRQTARTVDVVQGAALLLRRTVLDQIGCFDTSYFMYTEEVDLCQRMRQAGWSIYFVPTACIMHHGGQSTRQAALTMFLQLYRSKILYFRKHHGATATFLYKVMLFCATITRLGVTPLAWLEAPPRRRQHLTVANHYRHLVLTLPTM